MLIFTNMLENKIFNLLERANKVSSNDSLEIISSGMGGHSRQETFDLCEKRITAINQNGRGDTRLWVDLRDRLEKSEIDVVIHHQIKINGNGAFVFTNESVTELLLFWKRPLK